MLHQTHVGPSTYPRNEHWMVCTCGEAGRHWSWDDAERHANRHLREVSPGEEG